MGRPGRSASSVSILSDLSASGRVESLKARQRARAVWFAGMGAVVVIAAMGLWIAQDGAHLTEAQIAQAALIKRGVQQGLERRVDADLPRVGRERHVKSPAPVTSPGFGRGAGVVVLSTDREASSMPSSNANSVPAGPPRGRAVHLVDKRLSAKATLIRKESRRAAVSKEGGLRGAKLKASWRVVEGGKQPFKKREVNLAGKSGAKAGLKTEAPRSERDVDIITAIVK